jgi:signal transduction histidine kinase
MEMRRNEHRQMPTISGRTQGDIRTEEPEMSMTAPGQQEKSEGRESGIQNVYNQMEVIEAARKALLARKRFSVKTQIYIANALVFLFALGIAVILIANVYRIKSRMEFLEFANDFSIEIQQARRYEKNFFLYRTNLADALNHIRAAELVFTGNADQFASILGEEQQRRFLIQLDGYAQLLKEMQAAQSETPSRFENKAFMADIENQLRQYGKDMLTEAQGLMGKERSVLANTLGRTRDIHVLSLVALLILLVINTYLLVSRLFSNLTRFSVYAQRIAAGDFTPITPRRQYRDEFTELAIAINEMIKEITNREAALIQTHKMRAVGTLTAGVAHELNNPMNNIMLTAHMMMEDYATLSDSERLEMLQDVVDETSRAKHIVSNLLDFARESASTVETLDLEKILKDTISLAENQIRMSGIKIELQVTENLPSIHGDGQKLQQVFLNLILNAVDASSKGSKIQVIALPHEKSDSVALKVVDYGQGIPKHVLPSIFDPFFTTKVKGKGTGLGLSVSQGIVAKHGGRILVSSDEGSGSVFTVVLPVTTFPKSMPAF